MTLCFLPHAYAQEEQGGNKSYTLDECIALALHNSPEYKARLIQHAETRLQIETSKHAFLPVAQASLGNGWDFGRSPDKTGVLRDQSSQSLSASLSASVQLFSGFARLHDVKSAKLASEASRLNLLQAQQDISMQVTQLYFNLLHTQRVLSSAQREHERSREQLVYAQSRYQLGKWSVDKVTEAEAHEAQAALNITQAATNVEQAELDLRQALGLPQVQIAAVPIKDALEQAERVQAESLLNLEQTIASQYSMQASRLSESAMLERIKAQKGAYLPSLSMSVGYSNSYYKVLGQEAMGLNLPFADQWKQNGRSYISLNMNIPLFDAFRTRNQIRSSKLNLESLRTERLVQERKLSKELEGILLAMKLARQTIDASQRSLKTAEQAREQTQLLWKEGKIGSEALSQASVRSFAAEIDLLNAEARYLLQAQLLKYYQASMKP